MNSHLPLLRVTHIIPLIRSDASQRLDFLRLGVTHILVIPLIQSDAAYNANSSCLEWRTCFLLLRVTHLLWFPPALGWRLNLFIPLALGVTHMTCFKSVMVLQKEKRVSWHHVSCHLLFFTNYVRRKKKEESFPLTHTCTNRTFTLLPLRMLSHIAGKLTKEIYLLKDIWLVKTCKTKHVFFLLENLNKLFFR